MDFIHSIPPKIFLLIGALAVLGFALFKQKDVSGKFKGREVIKVVTIVLILVVAIISYFFKS